MNKVFFSTFKHRPAGTLVRGLTDGSCALQTDPDTMLRMATDYFDMIFSAEAETEEIRDA